MDRARQRCGRAVRGCPLKSDDGAGRTAQTSRYVALLRGVNVGRGNRLAMADLRGIVGSLGYTGVRTLLNSGNVVFDAPAATPPAHLEAGISEAIARELGLRLAVVVLSAADVVRVLAENRLPVLADDPSRTIVVFLAQPDDRARLQPLSRADWAPEALSLGERVAYLWCPAGVIASGLVKAVVRELGQAQTMRNWATVKRIGALVDPGL